MYTWGSKHYKFLTKTCTVIYMFLLNWDLCIWHLYLYMYDRKLSDALIRVNYNIYGINLWLKYNSKIVSSCRSIFMKCLVKLDPVIVNDWLDMKPVTPWKHFRCLCFEINFQLFVDRLNFILYLERKEVIIYNVLLQTWQSN